MLGGDWISGGKVNPASNPTPLGFRRQNLTLEEGETMYALEIWVANQDEVGADADYTAAYIEAAHYQPRHGVKIDAEYGLMYGPDPDALWHQFSALRMAVAAAGHGVDDDTLSPPELVACLPGIDGAAGDLQRIASQEAVTWNDWCKEAMIHS